MLVQGWADVIDGGPTPDQHWVKVSCLLDKTENCTYLIFGIVLLEEQCAILDEKNIHI